MKSCVILSVFLLFEFCTAANTFYDKNKDACLKELGIQPDEFNVDKPTKEQMCFFKCTGQKAGFLDASGKYIEGSFEKLPEKLSPEMLQAVNNCMKMQKDETCEQIYEVSKCVREKVM